jgi:hypothetical protein
MTHASDRADVQSWRRVMKWTNPIELFVKIVLAVWLFDTLSPITKKLETQQNPRGDKPSGRQLAT